MTAAVLAQTDWSLSRPNGSSVFFNQSVRGSERIAPIRRDSITPVAPDFWLSTGVTGSASAVQQMTNDLIADLKEWLAPSVELLGVEREVVALLPPNRQRVVNVVVQNAGRARPLVDVDVLTTDVPEEPGIMARLQVAAGQGNERAFIQVCQTIDWQTKSADDHITAIQLALAAGAHLAARHLALEAAQRFPDHVEIQKYAHVLSPPSVTKSTLPADPSVKANRDWLSTHGDLYRGQWVALQNGQLLGAASSPDALNVEVGNTRGALLTKVY
jgi:hypothetical protein